MDFGLVVMAYLILNFMRKEHKYLLSKQENCYLPVCVL